MAAAAYGYGVQHQDGFRRKHPLLHSAAGVPASTAARAQSPPRIPQISPNPDEPILLTPAAIMLSLAPANYCNKAR